MIPHCPEARKCLAGIMSDIMPCTFRKESERRDEDTLSTASGLSQDITPELEQDAEPHILFHLTVQLHNKPLEIPIYHEDATIQDLSDTVAEELHIPPAHQKFLVTPKTGLLRPPFKDPTLLIRSLQDKKIVLMGATTAEVAELESDIAERKARMEKRRSALQAGRKVKANKYRDWKKVSDEAQYTFHTIRPLPYLPDPEKSQRFLERLANDAGIKASMRSHGFSVGLLTEMNPAEHTTHESRTLGLNRNRGEVIELRLRTDAYDGYRDYKVIRKTLCHELAHNVWGEHDQRFWKLCREIEAEVEKNDWRRGGHSVGGDEFYNPSDEYDEHDHADEGGWEGGEYVLGGGSSSSSAPGSGEPLSRREIIARAAEERMKKQKEAKAAEPKAKSNEITKQ
ncbi:Ubiquitin and WLM domain-containing metalloprotease [Cercospora beticola]|uniref:Ubiquitin and WLM domain-containing metalloprotease n=2 Tax=Cercospora beticola TaxID=122368 RepID=A0A2G5I5N7_CERBT|nr:Ubiquitin and WLM domain-containing metalloprotease [Cercospora beticola]PIA99782.1 Ubiquitin and WLM domain-containing metalloprotease [Cercospora beticola]CAK1361871.1 unnamed protein product [Cercospora beticola]